MRLLYVYNELDTVSGETAFIENLKCAMAQRGFDVQCCAIPTCTRGGLLGSFDYYFRPRMLARAYWAIKSAGKYDVLHFLTSGLSPAARLLRTGPKVATSHFFIDSYLEHSPNPSPILRLAESAYARYVSFLDRPAFKSLDRLVACTKNQALSISRSYGIREEEISVIPPGIDCGYFRSLPRADLRSQWGCERVIAYLGRLHERSKGVSYLIRAMGKMGRDDAKLLVCGDGPDRAMYERMVRDAGLSGRIAFLGHLPLREKSIIQKSADAVVMPSKSEVFGTVFAESLACGTPVVAFDLPFWKGLYDGAGIFVKPFDDAKLASGIERALERRGVTFAARGKKLAQCYDLRIVADSYASLYEEVSEEVSGSRK